MELSNYILNSVYYLVTTDKYRVVAEQVIDWLVREIRDGEEIYLEDGKRIVGCSCNDLAKILGINCNRKKIERSIKRLLEGWLLEKFQPNKAYRDRTYYTQ